MPSGESFVTTLDSLKRPRVFATLRRGSSSSSSSGGLSSWNLTVLLVLFGGAFAAYNFRERLAEDGAALYAAIKLVAEPAIADAREAARPWLDPLIAKLFPGQGQAAYSAAATHDDDP